MYTTTGGMAHQGEPSAYSVDNAFEAPVLKGTYEGLTAVERNVDCSFGCFSNIRTKAKQTKNSIRQRQSSVASDSQGEGDARFYGATREQCKHFVIAQHGMWGQPYHVKFMAVQLIETLREKECGSDVRIMLCESNRFQPSKNDNTYEGVAEGGEKMFDEVAQELKLLPFVDKISFIGYSLGGLYARYTVGRLEDMGVFENVKPMNFYTMATPHMGVRRERKGIVNKTAMWLTRQLSFTGMDLLLERGESTDKHTARAQQKQCEQYKHSEKGQILYEMTHPESNFFKGLSRFEHLTNYCNMTHDITVPHLTAGIVPRNPFDKHNRAASVIPPLNDVRYPHVRYVEPAGHRHDFGEGFLPYAGDDKENMLREMYENLSLLPWQRVHCDLGPWSHGKMVVRVETWFKKGADVVQHAVDRFAV